MSSFKFTGLCTATHTPFDSEGGLNLAAVEPQAKFLRSHGITSVFIGGTTGESSSLTLAERLDLSDRWSKVGPDVGIDVIVHVGANCLTDAAALAARAERNQAKAVSMIAPSYFKPRTINDLIGCCEMVARAAPNTPFYYYDIPGMTGITGFPADQFLEQAADRIPNLAGIKYSNPDLAAYRKARALAGGRFDMPFGVDEMFLAAMQAGATAGVGSTYNFNPGPLQRVISALTKGDTALAEAEQAKVQPVVDILAKRGYMGAAKALMGHLGVPLGPARLPNGNPDAAETKKMIGELEAIGFFSWNF
ncbi:MAG: dihydrodipicolinate synthase family protein [Verrucomicrobia bacterium]|nr:dihydrodipicolinate synthase family protein [Verrucomicrobiota bacterium]